MPTETSHALAVILDGTRIAAQIKEEVAAQVKELAAQGIRPGLAAVLAGNDPASEIYVRNKVRACEHLGIYSDRFMPPASVTTDEMLKLVNDLNRRDDIDGILVQLPLPPHIHAEKVLEAVSPYKDIDGFHPMSQGMLLLGGDGFRPCTPMGIMKLLAAVGAITGPGNCFWIFLLTAILGAIIALILLVVRGRVRKTFFNVAWILGDLLHFRAPYRSSDELDVTTTKGMRLPHGALMAVGVMAFIFITDYGFKV